MKKENKVEKYWQPDLKDWINVDVKSYEFIYEEALKKANHELDVSKRITERAFSLILFIFPALTVISTVLIFPETAPKMSSHIKLLGLLNCLTFIVCLFFLINIVFPRLNKGMGRKPDELAKTEYLEHKNWKNDESYKFLLRTQLIAYNDIIVFNEKQNRERAKKNQVLPIST